MAGRTLQGKTALVTGVGKRIGRAIAIALAEEGVNIVIHYPYAAEEASELCTELHDRRMKSWLVKADFEVAAEYETLIARSLEMAGSLDILVNNASIFPANTLENVDLAADEEHGSECVGAVRPQSGFLTAGGPRADYQPLGFQNKWLRLEARGLHIEQARLIGPDEDDCARVCPPHCSEMALRRAWTPPTG